MITEMTKSYPTTVERDYFNVYGSPSFKDSHVFHEYFNAIYKVDMNKHEITELIRRIKPSSKAGINVYYEEDRILFCKPNRSVFPVFYVEFK